MDTRDPKTKTRSPAITDVRRLLPPHPLDKEEKTTQSSDCTNGAREGTSPETPPEEHQEAAEEEPEEDTQRARLLNLVSGIDLFRSDRGEGYARYAKGKGEDCCLINSEKFERWIRHQYYKEYQDAPNRQSLNSAINTLNAKAEFEGNTHPVHRRVAEHGERKDRRIYVDLCDDARTIVEISPDGWKTTHAAPVHFQRVDSMQPLPQPAKGGDLNLLRNYVNTDENGLAVLLAFLVQGFNPQKPYPLLGIFGEQGSGKSTLMRMIHQLVDPSMLETRSFPRSMEDLVIAAEHSWLLAFDNSSKLSRDQSDMLCRISTGASFTTRTKYSNRGEEVFRFARPVIINGIEQVITEPDLADRSIFLNLQRLKKTERKTEKVLWKHFNDDRPFILGALFDAVSTALRRQEGVDLEKKPRMADFAEWIVAAEPALPVDAGRFMEAYEANLKDAAEMLVKQSPVALEIFRLLGNSTGHRWEGTTEELRQEIKSTVRMRGDSTRALPDNAQGMTSALTRALPPLKKVGVVRSDAPHLESHRAFCLSRPHLQ